MARFRKMPFFRLNCWLIWLHLCYWREWRTLPRKNVKRLYFIYELNEITLNDTFGKKML